MLKQSAIERVAYKQWKFISVLEAVGQRSRCQHSQIIERALFQVADCHKLAVISHGGEQTGASTNPIHGSRVFVTSFNPNKLPKTLNPNTITLGSRVSTYTAWGFKNIQPILQTYISGRYCGFGSRQPQ